MRQSRVLSALEAAVNVGAGWLIALAMQLVLFPVIGLEATLSQTLTQSGAFSAVSLLRSYVLRRLFARLGHGRGA